LIEDRYLRVVIEANQRPESVDRLYAAEHRRIGQDKNATLLEKRADSTAVWSKALRAELKGYPKSFSYTSVVFTILYYWAVTLLVVLFVERRGGDWLSIDARRKGKAPRTLYIWLTLELVAPIVVPVLGAVPGAWSLRSQFTPSGRPLPPKTPWVT
jgi:hypothetical protein